MLCDWKPIKKEIEDWLDKKNHKFATQENRTPQVFEKKWLDHCVYTKIHEIFFASFPSELYEWIAKLVDSQGRCRLDQPIVWTPKLVHRLEPSKDKLV